jgi:tRNA pseudouridine13 synthase
MLCAHFEVGPEAIGTAGMKDRVAVTSQTVSVHLPRKPQLRAIEDPRVQVLWVTWHANKLRRGHLAGNRFSIRIRGIEPVRAPAIWRAIGAMERLGVPNHFGPQRFGMRANGHVLGALQLAGRHEELLGELLSTRGSPFPESERPAREAVDAGNYAEALRLWPRGLDAEYAATRALHRGADARSAVRGIRREILELWGDAWQSAVFNALLDARLAAGTLGAIEPGDVVSKQANGAKFLADDAAFAAEGEESLAARAARFEISATGPLPGHDAMRPSGAVLERERAAIAAMGVDPARFDAPGRRPSGDRRPFRIRLSNPEIEAGFDDHGTYVRVSFDLPAGAYATVALREALGDGLVDASAALPA